MHINKQSSKQSTKIKLQPKRNVYRRSQSDYKEHCNKCKKKNSTRQREDKQRCLTSDTMRV